MNDPGVCKRPFLRVWEPPLCGEFSTLGAPALKRRFGYELEREVVAGAFKVEMKVALCRYSPRGGGSHTF